jgi:hypothetical protein
MSKKLFHGSCHCGKIKYQVNIDLTKGSGKCDCTFCRKNSFWSYKAKAKNFQWLQGQETSTKYSSNPTIGDYIFCSTCGTMPFGITVKSEWTEVGATINLSTFDDISTEELNSMPITYIHDRTDWSPITDPEEIKTMY